MKKFRRIFISLVLLYVQLVYPVVMVAQEEVIEKDSLNVLKKECEFLITQQVEEEVDEEEAKITTSEVEALEKQYNQINQQITQKQAEVEELNAYLMEHFEALYLELFEQDDEFGYLDEEDQQRTIEATDSYREIEDQIDLTQAELYKLLEERQEVEAAYDHAYYLLEVQEEEKQIDEQTKKDLQTCLFYPYSVKKYQPKNILLNNEATTLANYLVSVTKYMEKLVPAAYTRLTFESIYEAFLDQESIIEASEHLPEWPLEQEMIEQYTYANELTLPIVHGVAQKAKEHYANSLDEERYTHFYLLMLQIKEAQYKYFYSINADTFEYLKDYLVDFLNTHQYTDTQSIQQIRAFQQRMQVKLVGYNDDTKSWYGIPQNQSGFYLEYQTKDLFDPTKDEFVLEYEDVSASSWLESNSNNKNDHSVKDQEPLSKNNQLATLKERLAKNNPSTDHRKELKKKDKKEKAEKTKDEKELPNTGESRSKLTQIIILLLVIGLVLLLVNYRKKRQQKQPIDELTLD
ncbi:LPXTG cell wall anchor domain-containing protein [Dolosicoccus paucivorans]